MNKTFRACALATLLLAPAGIGPNTVAALAQDGLPSIVLIGKVKVAPENREAFKAWIAEFRSLVDGMIAQNRLSQTDVCAYRSWRVLGPDAAGLNEDFLFVFEPAIPLGNYLLQHYVDLALDEEKAAEMMGRWMAIASPDPEVIYASPLDPEVDAIDLGEVCDF